MVDLSKNLTCQASSPVTMSLNGMLKIVLGSKCHRVSTLYDLQARLVTRFRRLSFSNNRGKV